MSRDAEVLDQLRDVIDPDLGKDIVTLGFIKNLQISEAGAVVFTLELTTPACPVKEKFKSDCETRIKRLPWVTSVALTLSASKGAGAGMAKGGKGLQGVKAIIAVASCKGGVGKSTVAVNLAYSLAKAGAKVGIFDADVYGPSLPTMVQTDFTGLYQREGLIIPLMYKGVKLMSFGYASANSGGGAAIMRGPMVSNVINQLLTGTNWGALDYLVIDMPPGTGDIQLTLTQLVPMTAAVIVTTPQQISFIDVIKGLEMFEKLKVPTAAVVENMSFFVCDQCSKPHYIFGQGALSKLVDIYGFKNTFAIPMAPEIALLSDAGTPVVLERPDSPVTAKYTELADAVVREVSKIQYGASERPELQFEAGSGIQVRWPDGRAKTFATKALRLACRCAHCINEMTGEVQIKDSEVSADIEPTDIRRLGNYAVVIDWNDSHSSIYSYDYLAGAITANDA